MNTENKKGILVIQSMGLGDLFFALPVLNVLRREYPEDPITFAAHERHREVLERVPAVSRIVTYQSKCPGELLDFIREVRGVKASKVFVLNPVFRGAVLAKLSGAPERIGYLRDFERQQSIHGLGRFLLTHAYLPREEKIHEKERYLDLLRFHGLPVMAEDLQTELSVPASSGKTPAAKPRVLINLGAGWQNRQWMPERIARTADYLSGHFDVSIGFTGGQPEQALAKKIQGLMKNGAEDFCGKTSLSDLAGLLKTAGLFITPDTGSMHLADTLGVPTLALFGPGDPVKVRPLSETSRILRHDMPCSPCRFQYTRACASNLCMREITVEEVLQASCEMLGETFHPVPAATPGKTGDLKKILYLQSTSEIGGTDITLLRTLQALDKTRFEPHVLMQKEGPLVEAYQQAGAKVHFAGGMRKVTTRKGTGYLLQLLLGYFPAVLKIRSLILEQKIDLVHTNTIHNLYGFLAARLAGKPHLWHIRELVLQSKGFARLEYFLVKHFSTRFLLMDNVIAEPFLGKNHGFPAGAVKLYDGIDLEKFRPGRPSRNLRAEIGIPDEAPLAGMVCRLDPWKGLDLFLEMAAKVHAKFPEVHFWVCGGKIEGHEDYELKLIKKTSDLGLENAVHFTGWKYKAEDIPDVYRSLDVSIQCPVLPEPYGLASLEAMASGVPSVVSGEGGPVELCSPEAVLFFKPRDAESLAGGVLKILHHKELGREMGRKGRERAEALFDFRKCTRELEKIYGEILS